MQHPGLKRKLGDMEFERRDALILRQQMLAPVLVLAFLVWRFVGSLPLWVCAVTLGALAVVAFATEAMWRREALAAMRREGVVGEDYEPPVF